MANFKNIFEEQVFLNTVLIENLTDNTAGTGFLITKNLEVKKNGVPQKIELLFSNKHVFLGNNWRTDTGTMKKLRFSFHTLNGKGKVILGKKAQYEVDMNINDPRYLGAQNPNEDVACFNVSEIYNYVPIGSKSIGDNFLNFDYKELSSASRVLFIGYPNGLFDRKNYLPILRGGTLSSKPDIDFDGERKLLIDAHVYPGSSGSPVFSIIKGNTYSLIGILSSAGIRGIDSIETISQQKKVPVIYNGIGYLYKVDVIKELIGDIEKIIIKK